MGANRLAVFLMKQALSPLQGVVATLLDLELS